MQAREHVFDEGAGRGIAATLGWPVVSDTVGKDPLARLLRLLETTRHDSLLRAPCDALDTPGPGPHADVLWMEEANMAVLHDGERGHPTCCFAQWDLADDLRRFLQNRGRAM